MNEQPQQPEPQEELDLFEWKEKNTTKQSSEEGPLDDELGWNTPYEELHGRSIEEINNPNNFSASDLTSDTPPLTDEDLESSARIADREAERQRLEDEENRQLTPEELDEWSKEINRDLFGKAS